MTAYPITLDNDQKYRAIYIQKLTVHIVAFTHHSLKPCQVYYIFYQIQVTCQTRIKRTLLEQFIYQIKTFISFLVTSLSWFCSLSLLYHLDKPWFVTLSCHLSKIIPYNFPQVNYTKIIDHYHVTINFFYLCSPLYSEYIVAPQFKHWASYTRSSQKSYILPFTALA